MGQGQDQGQGQSHLCVGVADAVVHQHHDEDRNGDAEVPDDPAELKARSRCQNWIESVTEILLSWGGKKIFFFNFIAD